MTNETENLTDTSTVETIRIVVNGVNYDAVPVDEAVYDQGEICECGHNQSWHTVMTGRKDRCYHRLLGSDNCECKRFTKPTAIDPPVEEPKPWPQHWDVYESIDSEGGRTSVHFQNSKNDRDRLAMGNVYRPGTAQAVVDRQKATVKVNNWIRENCEQPLPGVGRSYIVRNHKGDIDAPFFINSYIPSVILPLKYESKDDFTRLMKAQGENVELIMREVER